ncbi:MAG: AMP-binding protein [Alphaproteobacteria bacterium]|jgi:acyl-CoA synthetase (AMP-forming)/AMP-acid ligase II
MRPIDFFDNGHDRNPDAVCLVQDDPGQDETGQEYSYATVRELTLRTANGLLGEGFKHGARGAVLSINDPVAFTCALSFLRAGLAWVPINPGNALEENIHALQGFDCEVLFYHSIFEAAVASIRKEVPGIMLYVCIDRPGADAPAFEDWVRPFPADEIEVEDNRTDKLSSAPMQRSPSTWILPT